MRAPADPAGGSSTGRRKSRFRTRTFGRAVSGRSRRDRPDAAEQARTGGVGQATKGARGRRMVRGVEVGTQPPLGLREGRNDAEHRRRVSVRWFAATILTGLCGAGLMGGAVYASLDDEYRSPRCPRRCRARCAAPSPPPSATACARATGSSWRWRPPAPATPSASRSRPRSATARSSASGRSPASPPISSRPRPACRTAFRRSTRCACRPTRTSSARRCRRSPTATSPSPRARSARCRPPSSWWPRCPPRR